MEERQMHHFVNSLSVKQQELQKEGFTCNFEMMDGKLKCMDTGESFDADDIKRADFFRFEGTSDPEYMSILYAVETKSGCKGVAVNSYGVYSDDEMGNFMNRIEKASAKDRGL